MFSRTNLLAGCKQLQTGHKNTDAQCPCASTWATQVETPTFAHFRGKVEALIDADK